MTRLGRWLNRSLGRRIAVFVSVLLLVMAGAISAVSFLQVQSLTRDGAAQRFRQAGRQLSQILRQEPLQKAAVLGRAAADSAFLMAFTASGGIDSTAARRALRRSWAADTNNAVAVLDARGLHVLDAGPPGKPPWFGPPRVAVPAGGAVGPFETLSDSVIYYDVKVPLRGEQVPGGSLVLRTRVTLSPPQGEALRSLVGGGVEILVGSPATGIWTNLARVVSAIPASAIHSDSVSSVSLEGVEHRGVAQTMGQIPWVVLVSAPTAVIEAPANAYLRRAILVALVAVTIGAGSAVVLGHRLSSPIREITGVTEKLARGDEGLRADERSSGEIGRLAGSFNAMIDRAAQSTLRLRESEASLRTFVSHASQGIWHIDFDPGLDTSLAPEQQIEEWYRRAPLTRCNPALARMQRVEPRHDSEQYPLEGLFPRGDSRSRALLLAFIAQGYRISQAESLGEREGDSPRRFLNDLVGLVEQRRLLRIWGTRRDVTVERMLDQRLGQAQRLEAIGRLAGGVAHDFNNLLTVIQANAEMLLEDIPDGSNERAGIEEIHRTAVRAGQLTRQLLLFSRGQVVRPGVLELNPVVTSVEAMLRRVIGEDIALTLRLGAGLSHVRGDQGQLEQVIMNLVVNARDAMPDGGSLELRTDEIILDDEYVRLRPTLNPGRYVLLVITDTGIGMPAEVQQHAFEPFFTTKPKGKGTGLGLATVYGVVRQSGGDVAIYSEPGRGTTVKVFLPAESSEAVDEPPEVRTEAARVSGDETILLVEDEPALRDMVRRALVASGYTVIDAGDAQEALRLSDGPKDRIDLVLTDMILPGMSGRELAAELHRRRPGIPIIIMSGYTGETYPALESLPSGVGYIEKPFSLSDLRLLVRESLDRGPRSDSDGAPAGPAR